MLLEKVEKKIKQLQYESGAKIALTPDDQSDPSTRQVSVIGTPQCCDTARMMIEELVNGQRGGQPGQYNQGGQGQFGAPQNQPSETMYVPDDKVGLIIGKGGETVKSLQANFRIKIIIDPKSGPEGRPITLSGPQESIDMAKAAINEKLNQQKGDRQDNRQGGYGGRNDGYGNQQQGGYGGSQPQGGNQPQGYGGYQQQQRGPGNYGQPSYGGGPGGYNQGPNQNYNQGQSQPYRQGGNAAGQNAYDGYYGSQGNQQNPQNETNAYGAQQGAGQQQYDATAYADYYAQYANDPAYAEWYAQYYAQYQNGSGAPPSSGGAAAVAPPSQDEQPHSAPHPANASNGDDESSAIALSGN